MRMFSRHLPLLAVSSLATVFAVTVSANDWPQWRGPERNGVATGSGPLINSVPADGIRKLWSSEPIPSADDGGLGSVVTWNGRAYLSVVWHREVPSETRTITDIVMRNLGQMNFTTIGEANLAKLEEARVNTASKLRGGKLDEFIQQWIGENLDRKQQQLASSWVTARFKKGRLAIPFEDYDKLDARVGKPFPSDAAFRDWVEAQGFAEQTKREVYEKVPPTMRVAEDTVVCIEIASGRTLWKTAVPGEPRGRNCSSTPAVADGKVFALGSTQAHCVDALTGKLLWSAPLPGKAPGSSPLVAGGRVFVNCGQLVAFDAATGKQVWRQDKAGGSNASPVLWRDASDAELVICNGRNALAAVKPDTGAIVWSTPGGGDSTPAFSGNHLAVQMKSAAIGFAVYEISPTTITRKWNHASDPRRTQSSPIIHEGRVYHMEDGEQFCWELAGGKLLWKESVPGEISSPILADGKIFVPINKGNNIQILRAGGERVELGKALVRATWCPSPTIAEGKLLLRMKDGIQCFDIAAQTPLP